MNDTLIFVSDAFVEDWLGGAELTTEALINASPDNWDIIKIRSNELNQEFIDKHKKDKWIFGNFFNLNPDNMLYFMAKKPSYEVIEYDYKYCAMRIPELHKKQYGKCCEKTTRAQLIVLFMLSAKNLWYMSEAQKNWYEKTFPELRENNNSYVLSSILDDETIEKINSLDCSNKNQKYLIQEHNHVLKGTERAKQTAAEKNLEYELFSGLSHEQVLEKMAKSKGLIFVPTEADTCPRVTIEAKLLGCDLILSDNVQHKDEKWFSKNKEDIINYMNERSKFFWSKI